MHRFIRPVVMVMLATVSLQAFAQDKKAPDPEKTFKRKDSNGDGFLSLDEFKAKLKDKQLENADRRFGRLDTNADKKVSLEEFKAGIKPKP